SNYPAGHHRRSAHRCVADDENDRKNTGSFVRRRKGNHRADSALKACAKSNARNSRAEEEKCNEVEGQGRNCDSNASKQCYNTEHTVVRRPQCRGEKEGRSRHARQKRTAQPRIEKAGWTKECR